MDASLNLTALTASSQTLSTSARESAAIEKKAKEFESLMLTEFLKPMFESAKAPSLFGGDNAEQSIFGDMLQEKYAQAIAERGGIGIADQVKAALIAIQSQHSVSQSGVAEGTLK